MAAVSLSSALRPFRRAVLLRDGAGLTDGQLLDCFLSRREDAAFAALVKRHGPMVLGVCRRLLQNAHDADDAFQATFLALLLKASSIKPRERIGPWLYGVACRTSLNARRALAIRQAKERRASLPSPTEAPTDLDSQDVRPLLDEELNRLPDKYRVPVVLCYLEGKTVEETARQLGWPRGTVAGRLARARGLLAGRLVRRGLTLSGAAVVAALSPTAASATVPAPLLAGTLKIATLVAAGQAATTGAASLRVAALAARVLQGMVLARLKRVAAVLLVLFALAASTGGATYHALLSQSPAARPGAQAKTQTPPQRAKPDLDALARQYFQEAQALWGKDHGILWGTSLQGPLMFADPSTRRVVANQADPEGNLKATGGIFVGHLPNEVGIANTSVNWAGVRWVMFVWPLPADKYERANLLMHESWHRVQEKIGLPPAGPSNKHLDTMAGRLWFQLEVRALAAALSQAGPARRSAVADALTFRAARRAAFKEAATEERALEMHEGLAEYTGTRLCGLQEADLRAYLKKRLETSLKTMPTFVRSFAYLTGPAYGILLDEAGVAWRKNLKPADDLGDILQKALALELPKPDQAAEQRAKAYDLEALKKSEQKRERARQDRIDAYRARLVDGPRLELPLENIQYTFNPNTLEPLGDVGTVFPTIRMTDTWGLLTASKGVLVATGFKKVYLTAPADPEARPLRGDGWQLDLKDGWRLEPGQRKGDFVLTRSKK
jgi:RNA polymerase sigma factor (sigma-70 family)